jgi:hypothetical protein
LRAAHEATVRRVSKAIKSIGLVLFAHVNF